MFGSGIRLFRLFGVSVHLDYSWFIFFFLVTWTFGHLYFPGHYPELPVVSVWSAAVAAALLLFFSVVFHEMSHAVVANRLGFPIKRITLFIFGGVAHMKSEPESPRVEFLVAVAGPIASLFLWLFFLFLAWFTVGFESVALIALFSIIAYMNLVLALFNLVPGFPLDGGRLLRSGLWWKTSSRKRATNVAAKVGGGFAYLLMLVGVLHFFLWGGTNWIAGVWYLLIGVFLKNAAEQSYRHVLIEDVLAGITVAEIMGREVMSVKEDDPIDQLIEEKFLHHKFTAYPVLNHDGLVVGVIHLKDIARVPREERGGKSAAEVTRLIPLSHLPKPGSKAYDVLREMLSLGVEHLPVVESSGHLAGLVTRSDIMSMFQIRSDLAEEVVV
jgi:Zn-dependent protease/CBS domain-containing protein